jgi:circadian clock protein KaiB
MKKKRNTEQPSTLHPGAKILERGRREAPQEDYLLRLYVSGMSPNSLQAIENIQKLCARYLSGRHHLDIIDIFQQPELAREGQVFALPTLDKVRPPPLRRFVGDMSKTERILEGIGISPEK